MGDHASRGPTPPGLLCHMDFNDGHFHNMQFPVRIKTFYTHVVVENELGVREKRFNAHASLGITFEKPGRGRRVKPALAPEKRGPAQWVGPAEFSVPTRGFCCHVLNS